MVAQSESILIVGTGALACLFAARFAAVDIPVTLLGNWPAGVQALRDAGVRLIDLDGQESTFPVGVIDPQAEPRGFSHALVLVKTWQTKRAARQLADYLTPVGIVLTIQNGRGNRDVLSRALEGARVFTGVTTTGATLLGPGRVRMGGEGLISVPTDLALQPLADWFQQAGFAVETVPDIERLTWAKLVINTAINPLTALLEIPNGELLQLPSARVLMATVACEVAAVAHKNGISLPFIDPIAAVENVAQRTAKNHSSMLQDIRRGAPTEIEAICGTVLAAGQEIGVPTPVTECLYHLVKSKVENLNHENSH